MKNHHISEAGVSFEIQFGLWINIWAGEHIFYIWQQTIALKNYAKLNEVLRWLWNSVYNTLKRKKEY